MTWLANGRVDRVEKKELEKIGDVHKFINDFKLIIQNKNFDENQKAAEFLKIADKHYATFFEVNEFF